MTVEEIHQQLTLQFGDKVGPLQPAKRDAYCVVKADALVEICHHLKNELDFDCLMNLSVVEPFKGKTNQIVVYHLYSYKKRHAFILKVEVERENAVVPSLVDVWKAADWLEREQFDLLGVKFEGHPDLRRIMLPDDWVGHPLRKDYKEPGDYHQISHVRESPLDGFIRLDDLKKSAAAAKAAEVPAAKKELLQ